MLHSSTKFNIEKSLIEKTGAPSCSKVAKRQDKEEEKIIKLKKKDEKDQMSGASGLWVDAGTWG